VLHHVAYSCVRRHIIYRTRPLTQYSSPRCTQLVPVFVRPVCQNHLTSCIRLLAAVLSILCQSKERSPTYVFNRHDPRDVYVNDLKSIFNSPVDIPLGNISLCVQCQRLYGARPLITHKPCIVQLPSTCNGIWVVSEIGRVMEDYEERETSHELWSILVRTTIAGQLMRYLRSNHIVFEGL
jgi:hypothetical protein